MAGRSRTNGMRSGGIRNKSTHSYGEQGSGLPGRAGDEDRKTLSNYSPEARETVGRSARMDSMAYAGALMEQLKRDGASQDFLKAVAPDDPFDVFDYDFLSAVHQAGVWA